MKTFEHILLPLAALLPIACGGTGSASVDGDIDGYSFNFASVFAWIDAKETDEQDGRLVYKDRESKALRIHFSGASIDPNQDPRFMSVLDRAQISDDEALNGRLTLTLTQYEMVTAGQEFRTNGNGDGPRLSASGRFGLKELEPDSEYPPEIQDFGDVRSTSLKLDEAGKSPGESVAGTVTYTIAREPNDGANERIGSLTIEFSAPVFHEWNAECYADSDDCDPARPPSL